MRALVFALLLLPLPACAQIRERIYPAPKAPLTAPNGATLITVTTADGLSLRGLEQPGRADRPVILLLHGNGSSAADMLQWLAPLGQAGFGIVAAEYRGYSANPGTPSERGLAADADTFLTRARSLAAGRPVIVVGHSLGGGVAFGLAARNRLDALVTIGTFTRLKVLAPKIARAFVKDEYDNLAGVLRLDEPFYLIHGTADDVVPAQLGNELHNASVLAKRAGASFVVIGAGHNPGPDKITAILQSVAARLQQQDAQLASVRGVRVFPFTP
jgi:fermentation-respiration switch protein FrsA (DUF1100 family)